MIKLYYKNACRTQQHHQKGDSTRNSQMIRQFLNRNTQVITSAKEVMYSTVSVCQQDYAEKVLNKKEIMFRHIYGVQIYCMILDSFVHLRDRQT